MLLGAGHGALYSKLYDDTTRKQYEESRWYLLTQSTEYGFSLRNSHSVFLRSLAETGPMGLGLTLIPLTFLLLRPYSRSLRRAPQPYRTLMRSALAGCAGVIPAMLVEEFFISAFWVVVLWTMYAVVAVEGVQDESAPQADRAGAPVVPTATTRAGRFVSMPVATRSWQSR